MVIFFLPQRSKTRVWSQKRRCWRQRQGQEVIWNRVGAGGVRWFACRGLNLSTVFVCMRGDDSLLSSLWWKQDDSEDSETDGDDEDGSQSSTHLQAPSRFHRFVSRSTWDGVSGNILPDCRLGEREGVFSFKLLHCSSLWKTDSLIQRCKMIYSIWQRR